MKPRVLIDALCPLCRQHRDTVFNRLFVCMADEVVQARTDLLPAQLKAMALDFVILLFGMLTLQIEPHDIGSRTGLVTGDSLRARDSREMASFGLDMDMKSAMAERGRGEPGLAKS